WQMPPAQTASPQQLGPPLAQDAPTCWQTPQKPLMQVDWQQVAPGKLHIEPMGRQSAPPQVPLMQVKPQQLSPATGQGAPGGSHTPEVQTPLTHSVEQHSALVTQEVPAGSQAQTSPHSGWTRATH